jgi:hypothetical protein
LSHQPWDPASFAFSTFIGQTKKEKDDKKYQQSLSQTANI